MLTIRTVGGVQRWFSTGRSRRWRGFFVRVRTKSDRGGGVAALARVRWLHALGLIGRQLITRTYIIRQLRPRW